MTLTATRARAEPRSERETRAERTKSMVGREESARPITVGREFQGRHPS